MIYFLSLMSVFQLQRFYFSSSVKVCLIFSLISGGFSSEVESKDDITPPAVYSQREAKQTPKLNSMLFYDVSHTRSWKWNFSRPRCRGTELAHLLLERRNEALMLWGEGMNREGGKGGGEGGRRKRKEGGPSIPQPPSNRKHFLGLAQLLSGGFSLSFLFFLSFLFSPDAETENWCFCFWMILRPRSNLVINSF